MLKSFKNITTFVFDFDGVLTDGKILLMHDGTMLRQMNVKDSYALQLAIKKSYNVVIVSASYSAEAMVKLKSLGINKIFMQVKDKLQHLKNLVVSEQINKEEILYMGDDMPDYEVMHYCGLAVCPSDAVAEIKTISEYVSPYKGGNGCVRDVIEKVLKLQNNWLTDTHIPTT